VTITIYGAGAIGGVVGAFMAHAGEDVLFVDKAVEHVDAMNAAGLRISGAKSLQIGSRSQPGPCCPRTCKVRSASFSSL
jgi:ketopantoate reductase